MTNRAIVIADPIIPVPPQHYGGTERIVHLLCDGLTQRGWTIDLIAAEGSKCYGHGRLYTHRPPSLAKPSRVYRKLRFQLLSLRAASRVDVVIAFCRADYLWSLARTRVPLVVVFENPAHQFEMDWITRARQTNLRFVGVSAAQMAGLSPASLVEVVHNATDVDGHNYSPLPTHPPYVAFLGRMTANKGVHLAIDAAELAGVRLVIAGNVPDKEHGARDYFEKLIKPRLGPTVEWIGPVDDTGKTRLLGGATAMLFPIQWPEPCALVIPEAFACGCPVIGWRNGSVPEVIDEGITGFVVQSVQEMATAIRKASQIDRMACRTAAESRFSQQAMLTGYLRVIDQVVQ